MKKELNDIYSELKAIHFSIRYLIAVLSRDIPTDELKQILKSLEDLDEYSLREKEKEG